MEAIKSIAKVTLFAGLFFFAAIMGMDVYNDYKKDREKERNVIELKKLQQQKEQKAPFQAVEEKEPVVASNFPYNAKPADTGSNTTWESFLNSFDNDAYAAEVAQTATPCNGGEVQLGNAESVKSIAISGRMVALLVDEKTSAGTKEKVAVIDFCNNRIVSQIGLNSTEEQPTSATPGRANYGW